MSGKKPRLIDVCRQNDERMGDLLPEHQDCINEIYERVWPQLGFSIESEKVRRDLIDMAAGAEQNGQKLTDIIGDQQVFTAELVESLLATRPAKAPLLTSNGLFDKRIRALDNPERELITKLLKHMEINHLHPQDAKEIRDELLDMARKAKASGRDLRKDIGNEEAFCQELLVNCRRMQGRDLLLIQIKTFFLWQIVFQINIFSVYFLNGYSYMYIESALYYFFLLPGVFTLGTYFSTKLTFNKKLFYIVVTVLCAPWLLQRFIISPVAAMGTGFAEINDAVFAFSSGQYFLLVLIFTAVYFALRFFLNKRFYT